MNERVSEGRGTLMKATITVQGGKSSRRGQYGRFREQTKEAILVWLGTGGFAEEAALGGL